LGKNREEPKEELAELIERLRAELYAAIDSLGDLADLTQVQNISRKLDSLIAQYMRDEPD